MIVMWYSTTMPFVSLDKGGFHDRLREVDLTREVVTFCGGPVGTERERVVENVHYSFWLTILWSDESEWVAKWPNASRGSSSYDADEGGVRCE